MEPLAQIDIQGSMEEASHLFRRVLQTTSTCSGSCLSSPALSEALCMLWTYICTAMDATLQKQAGQI